MNIKKRIKNYFRKDNPGFTLVELLLAVAILSFILPVMITLINGTLEGFTSFDANQQLKSGNQKLLNNIYAYMSQCKRIFQNTANDNAFLAKVDLTGCPAVTGGSLLPAINTNATLSPNTTDFISAGAGNSLFFASLSQTQTLPNISGSTRIYTVQTDCYRFYYYYLTSSYPGKLYSTTSYNVFRWVSKLYADYTQVNSISDATKKSNTIKALYASGILYAFDTSQPLFANAFYTLSMAGTLTSTNMSIQKDNTYSKLEISLLVGKTGRGFRYGVSPNSNLWSDAPKHVPKYAVVNGNFPGGFEVIIVGSSGGRKVLVRSVLVAQGARKVIPSNDMTSIISAKDLW